MKRLKLFGIMTSALVIIAGVCEGSVGIILAWNPSLTDTNGQPLAVSPGYKLYIGSSSGAYSQCLEAGSSTSMYVTGLEYNKTYFFVTKAYTASGDSQYSGELVWTTPVMPDADADGISDSWEQAHFGSLEKAQNLTDCDGDGASDREEFLAGMDPNDPRDYPALAIHSTSKGTTITFEARQAAGSGYENRVRHYTLMKCTNLVSGIWTSVPGQENLTAANQTVQVEITPAETRAFYRTDSRLD